MSAQRFRSDQGKTYDSQGRLGTPGGFGSVIRVTDEEGEEFALKTLHFGVPSDVLVAEAVNLRSVRHPNVVGYVDFGTDPEPFLVMELADGGTLKDYINEARQRGEHFPLETVLEWSRQLLEGLSAIHAVLLHRDLKPGNVLLDATTVKIADFGIARLAEVSTRDETFKGGGTPAYMPPEGWAGLDGPSPTPAYDLYSLGVILFELVTLQLPFTGDREQLRHAHQFSEPPSPTTLRSDLPLPVERLILQLLRKTPTQRGQTAVAALELLATVPASGSAAEDATSTVLTRLQEGASTLMRQAAEREAEMARAQQRERETHERVGAGMSQLQQITVEAVALVEQSVAPLRVTQAWRSGNWQFGLEHSPRQVEIQIGPASSPEIFAGAGTAPGRVILFGHLAVTEQASSRSEALGGANVVGYTTDDAPWVVQFQLIELTNNALMTQYMRSFEPFFLQNDEVGQHGRWLWGGGMHVFQARHQVVTRDLLVEWLARLVPGST
jgi:hypothetical protein